MTDETTVDKFPPLLKKEPCHRCEGEGWEDCIICDGHGHELTSFGEAVLDLVRSEFGNMLKQHLR